MTILAKFERHHPSPAPIGEDLEAMRNFSKKAIVAGVVGSLAAYTISSLPLVGGLAGMAGCAAGIALICIGCDAHVAANNLENYNKKLSAIRWTSLFYFQNHHIEKEELIQIAIKGNFLGRALFENKQVSYIRNLFDAKF